MNFAMAGLRAISRFADLAAPAEPEAACLLQALPQRYGESSGRGFSRVCSAIRNDD
jgi:hypothetical protein